MVFTLRDEMTLNTTQISGGQSGKNTSTYRHVNDAVY